MPSPIPSDSFESLKWSLLQTLELYKSLGITTIPNGNTSVTESWEEIKPSSTVSQENTATPIPANTPDDANSSTPTSPTSKPLISTARPSIPLRASPAKASPAVPTILRSDAPSKLWRTPSAPLAEREQIFAVMRERVSACKKCDELACTRKQTVFGEGNLQPTVVFFGEAPGAEEDRSGQPFVGPAGQLLTKIIAATQMKREDVYILNALRCRPPDNRTPTDQEIENCREYFEGQLEVLKPKYIVCLGAVAIRAVLQSTETIGRLRGKFYPYREAKVMVTYHPSYLLRNESVKKSTWEDMQMLMRELGIPIPTPPKKNST
jgi:uracil-DNA glycosylase